MSAAKKQVLVLLTEVRFCIFNWRYNFEGAKLSLALYGLNCGFEPCEYVARRVQALDTTKSASNQTSI